MLLLFAAHVLLLAALGPLSAILGPLSAALGEVRTPLGIVEGKVSDMYCTRAQPEDAPPPKQCTFAGKSCSTLCMEYF